MSTAYFLSYHRRPLRQRIMKSQIHMRKSFNGGWNEVEWVVNVHIWCSFTQILRHFQIYVPMWRYSIWMQKASLCLAGWWERGIFEVQVSGFIFTVLSRLLRGGGQGWACGSLFCWIWNIWSIRDNIPHPPLRHRRPLHPCSTLEERCAHLGPVKVHHGCQCGPHKLWRPWSHYVQ